MTVVAELTVPAADFALSDTMATVEDVTFEFERIVTHSQEWVMPFLWVRGEHFERIDRAIREDPTVESCAVAEGFDGTRLYQIEWNDAVRRRINHIFDRNGTLLEATGTGDRWEILVRFADRRSLAELQDHFDRSDTAFTLQRILADRHPRESEFEISPRQREALVTAVEMGYYEIPRRTELAAVAEPLDITTSSVSERLRRGVTALTETALMVGESTADGGQTPRDEGDVT